MLGRGHGGLYKAPTKEGKKFHELYVLGVNDDLWDRVCRLGSETWKGCECVELLVVLIRLRGTGIISLIS